MSLIEGVGDEVTVGTSLFMLLCLVLLAWFSTHTRDIPFVSIIVVELSQRRNRNRNHSESAAGGEEEASSGQVESDSENGTVSSVTEGETDVGANNNAETYDDGREESSSAADSKHSMSQAVTSHCNAPYPESKADCSSSEPPEAASSDTREQARQSAITESQPEKDTVIETSQVSSQTPALSEMSSSECAEAAARNIMELTSEDQSSDEVRRRRVAYFENVAAKECQSGEKKADTVSVGAEWEKSSLGAQSQHQRALLSSDCSPPAPPGVSSHHGPGEESGPSGPFSVVGSFPPYEQSQLVVNGSPPPLPSGVSSELGPGEETAVECSPTCEQSQSTINGNSSSSVTGGSPSPMRKPPSASLPVMHGEDFPSGSPLGIAGGVSDRGSVEKEQNAASAANATGVVDESGQQIRVKLKYLNDTQRLVYADPQETVGNFRR